MTPSMNPDEKRSQSAQAGNALLNDVLQEASHDMPFDEQVSPLLDQALKAPAMPVDLAHRIFASTRDQLVAVNAHWTRRLGPIWLRRANAMAAGIVLASTASLFLVASGILRDAHGTVAAKQDIAQLGQYQGPQSQLDQDILHLAISVDNASTYTYIDTEAARTVAALEAIVPPASRSTAPAMPAKPDNYDNLF